MAVLPSSGAISLNDIRSSLGLSGAITLNDATVRAISPSGSASSGTTISFSSVYSYAYNPTISASTTNYNMKSAATTAGWNGRNQLNMTVTINSGVYVYSTSTGSYAFQTGATLPTSSYLGLVNNGVIIGQGGGGGAGGTGTAAGRSNGGAGGGAGPAFLAQWAISVTNNGTISGGGGGGGGGGGCYAY